MQDDHGYYEGGVLWDLKSKPDILQDTPGNPITFGRYRPWEIKAATAILVNACHGAAATAGWHHDINTGEPIERNVGEMLCLIHSEISEAMEGHRKNLPDDKLPHRPMIEVELADAVIRICDLSGLLCLDLAGALEEKMRFNATRPDHKREARLAAGGKRY